MTYPTHWKPPTCLVLDPSHRKRLALLVGLEDGRLVYTKRGGLFARRNDAVLYQGSGPIEAIAWRGNIVAWADNSGVKLLDIESLTRIAHIDRPTGARPTLYPTLGQQLLRPWLCFETSDRLLIAWGDCLMQMTVQETPAPGEGSSITMRRSVLCSMAWELDGVAAGVAPLDADRVAILAIILPSQQEQNDEPEYSSSTSKLSIRAEANELEVQIISRDDGTIQYADILPYHPHSTLHSTFALPRMDDVSEWYEYKNWRGYYDDAAVPFDLTLMTGNGGGSGQATVATPVGEGDPPRNNNNNNNNVFVDPHLQWNLKSVIFEEEDAVGKQRRDNTDDDDADSVDSDDYGFVRRPLNLLDDAGPTASPPVMVLASESDAVLASLSSVDDAVEHALLIQDRPALALKRALQHRRQLRRYRVADLVQHYLQAVLRLQDNIGAAKETLSLRRMTLAIQAMPALLGGNIEAWAQWAKTLETLPGALFLFRSYVPVRDPILPSDLYFRILEGMFHEYRQLSTGEDVSLRQKAAHHLLESLIAWGPTHGLNEFMKLYQNRRDKGGKVVAEHLRRLETALHRRYAQSAADFLCFPIRPSEHRCLGLPSYRYHANDSQDSLYSLDSVIKLMSPKAQLLLAERLDSKTQSQEIEMNDRVNLDAMARIYIMQGRYERALQAYLAIGALHSSLSMENLDAWAIDSVQNGSARELDRKVRIEGASYEFVLGLVEQHHLHRAILEPTFITTSIGGAASSKFQPLLALLKLVGLKRAGDFLLEHCVAPESQDSVDLGTFGDDTADTHRPETLPMDQVAAQLESTPALMHWYLNLVFLKRPELYVKFPNHSIPPDSVTELHRKHFELHIKFSGDMKDSSKVLSGLEIYRMESASTPFLKFLKVRGTVCLLTQWLLWWSYPSVLFVVPPLGRASHRRRLSY
jgi:vacuolar protein sorting-associated protein 41